MVVINLVFPLQNLSPRFLTLKSFFHLSPKPTAINRAPPFTFPHKPNFNIFQRIFPENTHFFPSYSLSRFVNTLYKLLGNLKPKMCVQEAEQVAEGMDNLGLGDDGENYKSWSLNSELENSKMENWGKGNSSGQIPLGNSFPVCAQLFGLFCFRVSSVSFCVIVEPLSSNGFWVCLFFSMDLSLSLSGGLIYVDVM